MRKFLRRPERDDEVDEPIEAVSADLAYELQSKMFDQLATVGIAGAGLAVTLISSVLRDASNESWLSVVLFTIAAVTAISGNQKLVDSLMRRRPCMRRAKRDMMIAVTFLGMAIGWLSMSVYAQNPPVQIPATNALVRR